MPRIDTPHAADAEAIEKWSAHLRRAGCRPRTVDARRRQVATASRLLPRGLVLASPVELEAWQDDILARLAVATRASYVSGLRQFYSWAATTGVVAQDLGEALLPVRQPRRQPRPLPLDGVVAALAGLPRGRGRLIALLGLYGGLRCCEIAVLRRDDVVTLGDGPVLVIRETKGGGERVVAIPSWLRSELLAFGGSRWVVERVGGGQVSAGAVQHAGRRALRAAGVDGSMHRLRHTHATALYALSGDLRMVQEQLGHASPSTTAQYTAWSRSAARVAVESLPAPGSQRLRAVP